RYNELLFIIDTCQGASMYERFYSPNLMALASSQVGEDSLSHQPDLAIGVHLMDRYTFYLLEFLEDIQPSSKANMNDLKPNQKDWHPPDGFILGLWTLILLVFFKTYGMKQLKHIF
ncbi:unnamed protein product, partial [Tetraodon nigroviridis]